MCILVLYILELLDWYKNCNKIFFSFQEFKNYKKLIYYQMAKYFIEKKRYKKLFIIMKRLSLYLNLKVIVSKLCLKFSISLSSIILSLTKDLSKFSAIKACLASIEKGTIP